MITASQVRAARALLNWTQAQLATKSGVAERTVRFFEAGKRQPYAVTTEQLKATFEEAGVVFLDSSAGVGVLLRSAIPTL